MIDELLAECGAEKKDIALTAFGAGPGSFHGPSRRLRRRSRASPGRSGPTWPPCAISRPTRLRRPRPRSSRPARALPS
ncbi:MAG: hypothetical protein ACLUNV_04700 [Sutterella wadsworthensis]